jgi:hypothetical protein
MYHAGSHDSHRDLFISLKELYNLKLITPEAISGEILMRSVDL